MSDPSLTGLGLLTQYHIQTEDPQLQPITYISTCV